MPCMMNVLATSSRPGRAATSTQGWDGRTMAVNTVPSSSFTHQHIGDRCLQTDEFDALARKAPVRRLDDATSRQASPEVRARSGGSRCAHCRETARPREGACPKARVCARRPCSGWPVSGRSADRPVVSRGGCSRPQLNPAESSKHQAYRGRRFAWRSLRRHLEAADRCRGNLQVLQVGCFEWREQ